MEREVAVEVDAASVLTRAGGDAVRVAGAHQPQADAVRRAHAAQAGDDPLAGALVAVHVADHEHAHGGRGIADAVRDERPVVDGVPDDHPPMMPFHECAGRRPMYLPEQSPS